MNERIRELLKQSCGFEYDEDGNELTPILVGKDLARFAQLIVEECADVIDGRDENGNAKDGDVIKEHFGVEE